MSKGFQFGRFEVRPAERQLLVDGTPASLGSRAFDVLVTLIERRNRVVEKNELLDLVWSGMVVEENNLQVQVNTLRKVLGPQAISTIPGRGYRFAVELDDEAPATTQVPLASLAASADASQAITGNLAQRPPVLVGRNEDLALLTKLVQAHPLVTIVGPPGIGKTTLGLATAHGLRDRWSDGAWVVELAPLSDPGQLALALARSLRISLSEGSPLEHLVGVLQWQTMLLVLDNCEHIVEAVAALAESILARAPGVRLLATSQELLNVQHEKLFKLRPLAIPTADELSSAERFGALQLFAERAQATDPNFRLSEANIEVVAEICRRLDGLPLAIELAAARVRLLGIHGVRDRLGERFRMLTGGSRTSMARHQTLQAAIDWSHALLSLDEQAVFRRLGVFVGGFTLDLAQQVARDERIDEWAVLDALGTLVDKSLVTVGTVEPPRYELLETIRAYALQKLADSNETSGAIERHARAVCDLFVQTEEARYGEGGTLNFDDFMQRLVPELGNARAAIEWAVGESGDLATAIALVGASADLFRLLRMSQEALRFVHQLIDRVDDQTDPERAGVFWSGTLVHGVSRLPKGVMVRAAARAAEGYGRRNSPRRLYFALYVAGWDLNLFGQHAAAQSKEQELAALEDSGWPAWVRCLRLHLQADIYLRQGRFEEALPILQQQQMMLEDAPGESYRWLICRVSLYAALFGLGRDEELIALFESDAQGSRSALVGHDAHLLVFVAASLVFLGRLDEGERTMRQAATRLRRDGMLAYYGGFIATSLAERGRHADAARVDGAGLAFVDGAGIKRHPVFERACAQMKRRFESAGIEPAQISAWRREGAHLDEAAIATLFLGEIDRERPAAAS